MDDKKKKIDEFLKKWRYMISTSKNDSDTQRAIGYFEGAVSMMCPEQLEYLKDRKITVREIIILDDVWLSIID